MYVITPFLIIQVIRSGLEDHPFKNSWCPTFLRNVVELDSCQQRLGIQQEEVTIFVSMAEHAQHRRDSIIGSVHASVYIVKEQSMFLKCVALLYPWFKLGFLSNIISIRVKGLELEDVLKKGK